MKKAYHRFVKIPLRTILLVFILLLTGIGVLDSQTTKKKPLILKKFQLPLKINCNIAKDVGVADNLYKNNLYALTYLTKHTNPITDAVVFVGNVVLKYSTLYQRYQGQIWERVIPQTIEVIIKTKKGEIIKGGLIRDYETTILSPANQSHHPSGFSLNVSWKFSGAKSTANLNVFDLSTSKHIYQVKNIFKNSVNIPSKVFSPGKSYLVQIRGKSTKGKFTPSDILLDKNSTITYSSSYAVTVYID